MNKITLLIPYFGNFPVWAPLFFETVRLNPTINFIFYTDCDFSQYTYIKNVSFKKMSWKEYVQNAQKQFPFFKPANAYKLCDLRPMYPIIHFEDIKNADFYGWTDMDILFGDIRTFYTNEILEKYDVLSTHDVRISGHLAIFRNTKKNRNLYTKIYNWKEKLTHPEFVGIDEHGVTNALTMTIFDKINEKFSWKINNWLTRKVKSIKTKKLYLKEQFTTPFVSIPWIDGSVNSNQPTNWNYKDGKITNDRDGNRNFLYLHFMNFKSSNYRHDGTKAPWENLDNFCTAQVEDMKTGITITEKGIHKNE